MNQINVTAIDFNCQGRQGIADDAIKPGYLIEQTATGFKIQATDGAVVEKIFALANVASGEDYTNAYAAGEMIQAFIARPGDEFYAKVAAGSAAVIDSHGINSLETYIPNQCGSGYINGTGQVGSTGTEPGGLNIFGVKTFIDTFNCP